MFETLGQNRPALNSTTWKRLAGLTEIALNVQIIGHEHSALASSVTGPALLCGTSESKIPTSVQNRPLETPDLEPPRRTINSVDYYHCVYELLYRLIKSSIALVPTLSPSQGATHHETPITA
jgi:hypothetical protein